LDRHLAASGFANRDGIRRRIGRAIPRDGHSPQPAGGLAEDRIVEVDATAARDLHQGERARIADNHRVVHVDNGSQAINEQTALCAACRANE
jgi:hypothetical protein